MKKLFIIPVLLICMTGASSNKAQAPAISAHIYFKPISTKVDSVNIKAAELNDLLRKDIP